MRKIGATRALASALARSVSPVDAIEINGGDQSVVDVVAEAVRKAGLPAFDDDDRRNHCGQRNSQPQQQAAVVYDFIEAANEVEGRIPSGATICAF